MQQKPLLLALLGGVLLSLSFPPYPFFLLAFVAFLPILKALQNGKKRFLLLYLTFFVYHYATNWWISSWQKDTDPYLFVSGFAVALVHPLFFIVPFLPIFFLQSRIGYRRAIIFLPFFWCSFEWLHSLGDLAYPWLTLGYTQAYNRTWIQISDIGGVWLVSFIIVLINVLIFLTFKEIKIKTLWQSKLHRNPKFIFALSFFILPYLYGIFQLNHYSTDKTYSNNKLLRVGIIQPNINPWRKWETTASSQIQIHKHIQDSLLARVPNIDLIVWSETAITFFDLKVNAYHNFDEFQSWIEPNNFGLLTGFADFRFLLPSEPRNFATKFFYGDTNLPYNTFNSLLLLNPQPLMNYEIYHKIRLTPFGEQIPYGQVLNFISDFLEWNVGISSWTKGTEQNLLHFQNRKKEAKVTPIICIESIYPDFVRSFIDKGGNFIVVVTNDGWYDHTFGPRQHYLIATFRAIENRRFVARCANTGISGIISCTGESIYEAQPYQKVGFAMDIPLLLDKTFYTRFGDWIVYLSLFVSLVILLIGFISPRIAKDVEEE
ncbi:MAG: apolipoprotein N-acyltransferase [Candidatus Kapaibacteriales bacterium]